MNKIRRIINNNRAYAWMVAGIILVNAGMIVSGGSVKTEAVEEVTLSQEESAAEPEDIKAKEELLKERLLEHPAAALAFSGLVFFFLIALILGTILNITALFKKRPSIERVHSPCRFADIARAIILFCFFAYIIALFLPIVRQLFHIPRLKPIFQMLIDTAIMDIAAFWIVAVLLKKRYKQRLAAIGLSFKNIPGNIKAGIIGYIRLLPILAIMLGIIVWVTGIFKYQVPPQPVQQLFLEEKLGGQYILYSVIVVCLLGPFVEELFFRGFVYGAIKNSFGRRSAYVLSASFFAALHANIVGFLPIMLLGLLLAYLYEKTGSLIASIAVHIAHNSAMVGMMLLFKEFGVF